MEKSLVFSATHLPAGQARARQKFEHSSFICDKTFRPKSVTSIVRVLSPCFVPGGTLSTRRRAVPPLKANSRYIIRHEELCTLPRRAQPPSALYAFSITLPGKKYRRFVWGESNEKCGAREGIARVNRGLILDDFCRLTLLGTFEKFAEFANPQFNRAIKSTRSILSIILKL